jgi:ferric-chelate reductase
LLAGFAGLLGAATLITLPDIVRHARIRGRSALKHGTVFFTETWSDEVTSCDNEKQHYGLYNPASKSGGRWSAGRPLSPLKRAITHLQALVQSAYIWTPTINLVSKHTRPRYLSLSTGPILLVILSACIILSTILPEQQLVYNANRLGFLALGLIPVIFLLAMKSFSPLVLLLGKSYEKLNFLHRWIGRMLLVILLAHASLWINSWQKTSGTYTLQMLSQSKQIYGITALSFLVLLAASSVRPARSFSYPTFFFLHVTGFVGFIVAVSYHTPYARSWTGYTVCGIYGLDLVGRICKWRIRSVVLEPLVDVDGQSTGVTRIVVQDLNGGWLAGQHVQVRVFFNAASKTSAYGNWLRDSFHLKAFRSIESHPFTIAQAPPHISILPRHQSSHGFALYARIIGPEQSQESWTADLNHYASASIAVKQRIANLEVQSEYAEADGIYTGEQTALMQVDSKSRAAECTAMLEGPYGGLAYQQLETQESLLLVACGSGMSFVLALLDDTVGRVIRGLPGARTKHIRVVWVVRHEGGSPVTDSSSGADNLPCLLQLTCCGSRRFSLN